MLHVPYRGSAPALTDLLAGQVQVMFESTTTTMGHIRDGKLRPLAVTPAMRLGSLPEIPTMNEFLPGYEGTVWGGVGVPRNTPTEIIEKLNKEINAALVDPKMKARFAEIGSTPMKFTPPEFGSFMGAEVEKWGKVVKFSGARAD
jgi:tripartite-type tricarboxylate transporter receptor subunit TctC